jgi:hypothetical protein
MEFSTVGVRRNDGPVSLRARVPRGPRLKRHGPGNLSRVFPFALDVRHLPQSDYASWHVPYKVVFTPDEAMMDEHGNPFPSAIVDVDENGMVRCAWRKGSWDYENLRVRHLEEVMVNPERGRVPARVVAWRAKMIPERGRPSGPTQRALDEFVSKAERSSSTNSRSLASYDHDLTRAPAEMKSGDTPGPGNVAERNSRKRIRTAEEDRDGSGAFPSSKKQRVTG